MGVLQPIMKSEHAEVARRRNRTRPASLRCVGTEAGMRERAFMVQETTFCRRSSSTGNSDSVHNLSAHVSTSQWKRCFEFAVMSAAGHRIAGGFSIVTGPREDSATKNQRIVI